MLLHKHVDRVVRLDPQRIGVSLDGATAEVNGRIRGLPGAFEATVASVRTGLEVLDVWDTRRAARWDPQRGDAITVIDYRSKVERWTRRRRQAR